MLLLLRRRAIDDMPLYAPMLRRADAMTPCCAMPRCHVDVDFLCRDAAFAPFARLFYA